MQQCLGAFSYAGHARTANHAPPLSEHRLLLDNGRGPAVYQRNPMKYEVRWSNGFWKTFDTDRYESVAVHHSEAEAIVAAARANGK